MNRTTSSRILFIIAFSFSAIGGYTLFKFGIIFGISFFVAGTIVLIIKWKYADKEVIK